MLFKYNKAYILANSYNYSMLWFSKKEEKSSPLHSSEWEELIKRLTTCEARLNSLEIENTTLRNKVLRKIQRLPTDSEAIEETNTHAKVFNPMFVGAR